MLNVDLDHSQAQHRRKTLREKTSHNKDNRHNPNKKMFGKFFERQRKSKIISKQPRNGMDTAEAFLPPRGKAKSRKRKRKRKTTSLGASEVDSKGVAARKAKRAAADPSLQYISNPLSAPVVKEFRGFFAKQIDTKKMRPEVHVGEKNGWRTVAKLSVRQLPGERTPKIGIFAPRSHRVISLTNCPVHHPRINRCISLVAKSMKASNTRGYNGENHGGVSYISLSVERSSGKVCIVFVWNASSAKEAGEKAIASLLDHLCRGPKSIFHSIWCHYHRAGRHDNSIFGRDGSSWELLWGSEKPVSEKLRLGGLPYATPQLYFPPNVFRQANLDAFAGIVRTIRWHFPRNCKACVELYGGVGTIGLYLLDFVDTLRCSDANPFNKACFDRTVETLDERYRAKPSYITGSATERVLDGELDGAEVVVVDPPRKGLDVEVVRALTESAECLDCLIYVSCGFKAFQRDYASLQHVFKPIHVSGHVLFPGSNHIETLCIFRRRAHRDKK